MQLYFQQWTILKRNRKNFYLQVNYFTRCIFLLRYYTVTVGFVVVCLSWLGFPWKQTSDKQVQASYLGSNSRNQEWGRKESEGKKEIPVDEHHQGCCSDASLVKTRFLRSSTEWPCKCALQEDGWWASSPACIPHWVRSLEPETPFSFDQFPSEKGREKSALLTGGLPEAGLFTKWWLAIKGSNG